MTNFSNRAKSLLAYLNQHIPEKHIIWGGIHSTVFPEDAIQHANAICIGEGEMPLLEFAETLKDGRDPTSIRNLWMRVNGKVVKNNIRPLLTNAEMEKLPPMDYGVENNYILDGEQLVPLTISHYLTYCGTTYNTIYTIGCPFSCTYCSNNVLAQLDSDYRHIRLPSIKHLVNELSQVKNKNLHVSSIVFHDDSFLDIKMYGGYVVW